MNALWLNALVTMAQFARVLGLQTEIYEILAERARDGFKRLASYILDRKSRMQGSFPVT